jgi:hypothetical protein
LFPEILVLVGALLDSNPGMNAKQRITSAVMAFIEYGAELKPDATTRTEKIISITAAAELACRRNLRTTSRRFLIMWLRFRITKIEKL